MKRNNLLMAVTLLLLNSCSVFDKNKTETEVQNENPADNVDFVNEVSSKEPEDSSKKSDLDIFVTNKEKLESKDGNNIDEKNSDVDKKMEPPVLVYEKEPVKTTEVLDINSNNSDVSEIAETGEIKIYKVKNGETLMQIAFKIYGDISKWKDLKKLNQEKVSRNSSLISGMSIKYKAPVSEFVWNPEGNPYLIKNGETLGTISNTIYQTTTKWNEIWKNNKPLIKNPNLIYSGFTLYYIGEKIKSELAKVELPEVAKKVSTVFSGDIMKEGRKELNKTEVLAKESPSEPKREISSKK